jgi:ubiquinone/menaquinone biosynthesis C-methylase UbiE
MNKEIIRKHFDSIAGSFDKYEHRNHYYHSGIRKFCKSVIPENEKVLEIGCATGELLNYLRPKEGVGIDFSSNMIEVASKKYPHLKFHVMAAEQLSLKDKFDYVVMSNLFDYLEDIWVVLENVKKALSADGKVVITTVNPVWEPIFRIGQRLKLRTPDTARNFITNKDVVNLLQLHNFEILKEGLGMFIPKNIPIIAPLFNLIFPELSLLRQLCVLQYVVAKVKRPKQALSCSVVIPCHNERDNIETCLRRIPKMGVFTEAIVVDDGSLDDTAAKVNPGLNKDIEIKLISYKPNRGKGHAVKVGFDSARGDVLMILDADMAVIPEELPRFFRLFEEGFADFVNGTRVIYPMEQRAMPILNYIGNKIFSLILSRIIEQRVSDTLCGTKALFKRDYKKISMKDASWGDFDLLFGAAKLCLKIYEMPVHYKIRTAGKSKMKAFKHGWILFKVCWRGLRELKLSRLS